MTRAHSVRVLLFLVLATALVLLRAGLARADEPRRAGTVRLESHAGSRGPLELYPSKDGFAGELSIVNDGKEPLVVSRVAVRGDATDPRSPPKLVARLAEGSLPVTIPPGATRKAQLQWNPERGMRMRQLYGHVVVTTSDEQSGEVAMGVHAQMPSLLGPLEAHVVSLLVGVPLVGAIATFLARAVGRRDDKTPHAIACVALALQAAVAIYIYRGFAPDVSRLDGNDGVQFVEHVVWIRSLAAELYLGVDGTSVGPVLVTSIVALLGLLPERSVPSGASGYHAAYLVLSAAASGALCAMDALLFLVFVAIAVVSAVLLVGGWGASGRRPAATRLAVFGTLAVVLLVVAVVGAARSADPTFLVDGTKTTTTFSMPELSRVALGAKDARLLGAALPKTAFACVLVASIILLGAFPLHGWLGPVLVEAPTGAGVLVSAALPALGTCTMLRLGCSVLPDGMRWASGVVVALGAVSAAYGAFAALGQNDMRRLAASATTSNVGFVLLGAGSLTPQGISGAMVLSSTRALACGLFLVLAGAVFERVRTRDVDRLSGAGAQMPGWATALAAAALAQAGMMGLAGAWGPMLALFGALPNYAPLAVVSAFALVVVAAAHFFALGRVVFGKPIEDWQRHPLLEPFGGRMPDLTPREWTTVAPLLTLVVLLGVWPAPLIASTSGTARDLTNAVSPPGPEQIAQRRTPRSSEPLALNVRGTSL
jgi:NADH-quinone oxidoreductase subunit M